MTVAAPASIPCSDVVYVKVATGVGAGLVLNGRLYHGAGGTAGEIGHVTIDEAGPVCRCGNRGCLEAFAGAEAVLEPLRRRHGERLTLRQVVLQAQARDAVGRSAITATREVPILAGVVGERAEVLGAVALVLRESQRFVAEPERVV
jgi:predicted NBD/HSP70 family sugar kinase